MAIFRKVHVTFWSDPFISELDTEHKLFYLYLMTNENTKQCGIYEITKKQMAFDLGYSMDRVSALLAYFTTRGKIKYNAPTSELALRNWLKYNGSDSPKVFKCIEKEQKLVKDKTLIEYQYSIHTLSQQEQEQQPEQKEEKDEVQNPTSENPKANPDKKTPSVNPMPPTKPVQSNLERFKETVTDQESAVKYLKGLNRALSIKRILQLAESFNIAHTEEHPVSNYENWKKYFRYFLNNHREPKMPENAQGPAYKPYNPRS
jgi:hypothetical protein